MYTGPPYIENIEITNKQVDDHPKQPRNSGEIRLLTSYHRAKFLPTITRRRLGALKNPT